MILISNTDSLAERASSVAQFITVLAIFVLVLFITVFVTRWLGNYQKNQGRNSNIEVIESLRISPSVCVEIVRIGKRYVALSVGKDSSSFIMELSEDDIKLSEDTDGASGSFADIIGRIKGNMHSGATSDGAEDLQDE